jgi:predicted dehydrogenase
VLGAYAYALYKKKQFAQPSSFNFLAEFESRFPIIGEKKDAKKTVSTPRKTIRLGFIGFGSRGASIARSAGFAHPDFIESLLNEAQRNPNDKRYEAFSEQEDLNIAFTGVCDVFKQHAQHGSKALANTKRLPQPIQEKSAIKQFADSRELIHSPEVDAVIIATPDHWHAEMIIEAAKAGKHVYCEKCMTNHLNEAYEVRKAVVDNNIVFQLGHQNRQSASYIKASHLLANNILGPINLIETSTNRNSPDGAWVYEIPAEATIENIDWERFIKPGSETPFSAEKFFRWRCFWEFGSGLAGDMLTHEYDCINQVLQLGIPERVTASGGIYYWKDGREVPDVLNVLMEYPSRDLTLMYSASLSNAHQRPRQIMGQDASMELGGEILVKAEANSKQYADHLKNGKFNADTPLIHWQPGLENIDAITSPTQKYFASRGLMYTMHEGKITDTTFLHVREWLEAIRNEGNTSCNIHQGFQEAITAHMAGISYREKRMVQWDPNAERII